MENELTSLFYELLLPNSDKSRDFFERLRASKKELLEYLSWDAKKPANYKDYVDIANWLFEDIHELTSDSKHEEAELITDSLLMIHKSAFEEKILRGLRIYDGSTDNIERASEVIAKMDREVSKISRRFDPEKENHFLKYMKVAARSAYYSTFRHKKVTLQFPEAFDSVPDTYILEQSDNSPAMNGASLSAVLDIISPVLSLDPKVHRKYVDILICKYYGYDYMGLDRNKYSKAITKAQQDHYPRLRHSLTVMDDEAPDKKHLERFFLIYDTAQVDGHKSLYKAMAKIHEAPENTIKGNAHDLFRLIRKQFSTRYLIQEAIEEESEISLFRR